MVRLLDTLISVLKIALCLGMMEKTIRLLLVLLESIFHSVKFGCYIDETCALLPFHSC